MSKRTEPRDEIERQRRRIATEGLPAAVSALISVCEDPKAPAPAKATAGTSLLRAAGLFDKPSEGHLEKQPHEMTAEELARAIAEIRAGKLADDDEPATTQSGRSVFD